MTWKGALCGGGLLLKQKEPQKDQRQRGHVCYCQNCELREVGAGADETSEKSEPKKKLRRIQTGGLVLGKHNTCVSGVWSGDETPNGTGKRPTEKGATWASSQLVLIFHSQRQHSNAFML